MKLYCYFLPDQNYKFTQFDYIDELIPVLFHNRRMFLYAFTDNKGISKEFEMERNMRLFKRQILYIDEGKEYDEFCIRHGSAELGYYLIPSEDDNVNLLMTEFENSITIYCFPFYAASICDENGYMPSLSELLPLLKKKYIKAIDYLEFYRIDEMFEDDAFNCEDMRGTGWNLLNLFVALFKELF